MIVIAIFFIHMCSTTVTMSLLLRSMWGRRFLSRPTLEFLRLAKLATIFSISHCHDTCVSCPVWKFYSTFSTNNNDLPDDICSQLLILTLILPFQTQVTSLTVIIHCLSPALWYHELEESYPLSQGCKQVKWINKSIDDPPDHLPHLIEQFNSNRKNSDNWPTVFVSEWRYQAVQLFNNDESITISTPLRLPQYHSFYWIHW